MHDKPPAYAKMIHSHWLKHQPQHGRGADAEEPAVAGVAARPRSGRRIFSTNSSSVKKMDYQEAWELATEEWTLPETEALPQESSSATPTLNPPSSPRATSE